MRTCEPAPRLRRKSGFTLIELSIVLVIIGLIVGGVLVGKDLINASKKRKLISEIDSLNTSINVFQSKYDCIPGDCRQATKFFGMTATNGVVIINGDNNGLLDRFPGTDGGYQNYSEVWQFPVQLSTAGLTSGKFSGTFATTGATSAVPGVNVIASTAYPNTGFTAINWEGFSNIYDWSPGIQNKIMGNVLLIGTANCSAGNCYETAGTFISPLDAFAIDKKIDDGNPASGILMVYAPTYFNTTCVTSNNPNTAQYGVTNTGDLCSFIYLLGVE